MSIRLIALDLDQTTLRRDKSLSAANRAAIGEAIAAGVEVAVASGRALASLPESVTRIPGLRYAITSNGAAVCDLRTGERIQAFLLEEEAAEQVLSLVPEELPLEAFVEGVPYADAAYVAEPTAFGPPVEAVPYIQASRTPVEDMRAFIREHIASLDALDVITRDQDHCDRLRSLLAESVPGLYLTSSAPNLLEISDRRAGKHAGAAWLAEQLGIAREETAAFGDAENDREMILWAGLGIAVANAAEGVRAAADLVTDSNEEDGVARGIREILLRNG